MFEVAAIVHEEIRELYKEHLDAPVWSYTNQKISTLGFVDAFEAMIKELPDYHEHTSAE